ncbi:hypothetical protein AURDEDRAFT_163572, partial [Auricularia subglabra TFB-10046 SS5]
LPVERYRRRHLVAQPSVKIAQNLCTFLCFDEEHTPVFEQKKTIFDGVLSFKSATAGAPAKGTANDKDTPPDNTKAKVMHRGATLASTPLSTNFGAMVFDAVPRTWDCMAQALTKGYGPQVPTIHEASSQRAKELFPSSIAAALRSRDAVVRRSAAKCFARICNVLTTDAMRYLVETILPFLNDPSLVANRQWTVELIYHSMQILDIKALPYVIFLIVPVLVPGQDCSSRGLKHPFIRPYLLIASRAGLPDPPGFPEELLKRREEEREFLSQLLDSSKVVLYAIPVKINAELREYRVDGISWLAFLAAYHLHGILCDGLGKTLQSITILASKHRERAGKYKATKSPKANHLPSLVFTDNLRPLMYVGTRRGRTKLLPTLKKFDVIITYDVMRNAISNLMDINWHYCILDEGKNPRTKLPKAVKCIRAQHRLLLLGMLDCGIWTSPGSTSGDAKDDLLDDAAASSGRLAQQRVLIFSQMKRMIDIIEEDLFKRHMPYVTYTRLDGNADTSKRRNVMQAFNADPSIDCLLLTTNVGGLGLTLTGADTSSSMTGTP